MSASRRSVVAIFPCLQTGGLLHARGPKIAKDLQGRDATSAVDFIGQFNTAASVSAGRTACGFSAVWRDSAVWGNSAAWGNNTRTSSAANVPSPDSIGIAINGEK